MWMRKYAGKGQATLSATVTENSELVLCENLTFYSLLETPSVIIVPDTYHIIFSVYRTLSLCQVCVCCGCNHPISQL